MINHDLKLVELEIHSVSSLITKLSSSHAMSFVTSTLANFLPSNIPQSEEASSSVVLSCHQG